MSGRPSPITWHELERRLALGPREHRRDCPATAGVLRFAAERLRVAAETSRRIGCHEDAETHLWAAERLERELDQ